VLKGVERLRRPGCWITFDDAYVDVVDVVAPLLKEAGIPASVFVSTAVLDGTALPADRWYATLNAAKRRRGTLAGVEPWEFDLDEPGCVDRFIDGPEKRQFLRSTPEQQEVALLGLAAALDSDSAMPSKRLYLNTAELQDLTRRGWSVGSHAVSHSILVSLTEERRRRELEASRERLRKILGSEPQTFAYPDGAWDDTTAMRVREAGYAGAVTLVSAVARPGGSLFAIPRVLAPNDANFVQTLISPGQAS
jgi:peptidoglycan/xylan/chitin deacetylase (PgdA/CDA1 family)